METQDIKSRLLEMADSPEFEETPTGKLMFEAAAELSRLRAEVVRLREALRDLVKWTPHGMCNCQPTGDGFHVCALCRARKALEGGE